MSLYLCIVVDGEEAEGLDVGSYGDFNALRRYICAELENGIAGLEFPALNRHSDCDGEWGAGDCAALRGELAAIAAAMQGRPALDFPSDWQRDLAQALRLAPRNAAECFLDADGEPLLEGLLRLAETAVHHRQPILFQ